MWKLEFFHLLTYQNYEENQQKLGTFSKIKVFENQRFHKMPLIKVGSLQKRSERFTNFQHDFVHQSFNFGGSEGFH